MYWKNRYYSIEQGRFINRDPLGYIDGTSLYRLYGFNDELGTDITVERGNSGGMGGDLNDKYHRQICVDVWDDNCNKIGKQCFSFGLSGVKIPHYSSSWLGFNSTTFGGYLKGKIYKCQPVEGAEIERRHITDCKKDKKWLNYMYNHREGLTDTYSLLNHNCIKYSNLEFDSAPIIFNSPDIEETIKNDCNNEF